MTTYTNGPSAAAASGDALILTGQNTEGSGQPVYMDNATGIWKLATSSTPRPSGFSAGSGAGSNVYLGGRVPGFSALSVGASYWLLDGGGIGLSPGSIQTRIGTAISATELLLDIEFFSSNPTGVAGYTAQGGPSNASGYLDKMPFSTEVNARIGTQATAGRYYASAVSSSVAGYVVDGGQDYKSSIDKLAFSTDVSALIASQAAPGHYAAFSGCMSPTAGYIAGGWNPNIYTSIKVLTFSNDVVSTLNGALISQNATWGAGFANSANAWFAGGFDLNTGQGISYIVQLPFATNTPSLLGSTLVSQGGRQGPIAYSSTTGYTGGGASAVGTRVDKFVYATLVTSAIGPGVPQPLTGGPASFGNSLTGYAAGGQQASSLYKMSFATEGTWSILGAQVTSTSTVDNTGFANNGG
jgi:hypothetical protein